MSGAKSSKVREDKTKKRKRDTVEADKDTKRHRKDQKTGKNPAKAEDGKNLALKSQKKKSKAEAAPMANDQHAVMLTPAVDGISDWKVSKPMGGRMLDIDPILTEDEEYLIITYNTSIQVYSAADSLLLRRIPIVAPRAGTPKPDVKPVYIVDTKLSRRNSDLLWVACSDGEIFSVNWREPAEQLFSFGTGTGTAKAISLITVGPEDSTQEAILVVESDRAHRMDLAAYLVGKETAQRKELLSFKKAGQGLQLVQSSKDGSLIVGALNDRLFIGTTSEGSQASFDELSYEVFSFDAPDIITSIDFKVDPKPNKMGVSRSYVAPDRDGVVDIIVGGARGAIYRYQDALTKAKGTGKAKSEKDTLQAQKYHWHRKAVHSAKWSRDGNYMISGGSENVLIMWQMDTSKINQLPHLSGAIENIVVSETGASYVLHLDDNSAMILSTAELKPTAYISGIQSSTAQVSTPKDMLVRRTWSVAEKVWRRIPAAIRSSDPSQLHVCVGSGAQAAMSGVLSAPLLQTFDLESFTSVNRQPLARTQPTDMNLSNKGFTIEEPLVTHLSFSSDGQWLASVDVWNPPEKDVDVVVNGSKEQFIRERQEVYLKFWQLGASDSSAALVSRVNAPHSTDQPESVLDLAADPISQCFATIGSDGIVRVWRPRVRQQNGLAVKGADGQDACTWACSKAIPVGDGLGEDAVDVPYAAQNRRPQGSLSFSEDGSTIFAAYGVDDSGVVYIIDAASGEIVRTLEDLWTGTLRSIRTLSPFIVVLSRELRVFDVVGDELRYGIKLPGKGEPNDLLQLAVDYTSRHFAVSHSGQNISNVGIFSPEEAEPRLVKTLPHNVVSLVSTPNKSGFLALDDAAQVWTIAEGSDASSLSAMQPLTDLRLDDQPATNGVTLIEEDAEMASDDEAEVEPADDDVVMAQGDDDDDDDTHAAVVVQQHLADIFDAAPAFAAPSVEEMFYKVTDLLGAKPLLAVRE